MVDDKILVHEDLQLASMLDFYVMLWIANKGNRNLPDLAVDGVIPRLPKINAYINHGRWIAECPGGCGDAVVASKRFPYYICTQEKCPVSIEGKWHEVVYPAEADRIERILKHRKARRADYAFNRNWTDETIDKLNDENERAGLPRGLI